MALLSFIAIYPPVKQLCSRHQLVVLPELELSPASGFYQNRNCNS